MAPGASKKSAKLHFREHQIIQNADFASLLTFFAFGLYIPTFTMNKTGSQSVSKPVEQGVGCFLENVEKGLALSIKCAIW